MIFSSDRILTRPVGWEKNFLVTSGKTDLKNLEAVSKGQYISAVFEGTISRIKGIYVSVSFNGGNSFLKPVLISRTGGGIDKKPHIAVSGKGQLVVVWQFLDDRDTSSRILYSISNDMGASWTVPVRIKTGFEMDMLPRVYYDNRSIIHLFYHAYNKGAFNLFHAYKGSDGMFKTTGTIVELGKDIRGAFFPSIVMSGNSIFMVWQGKGNAFTDDLYFMKSEDYGDSWSNRVKITASAANDASPSLFLYRDIIYLAYQNNDDKTWSVKLLRGFMNGKRWEKNPLTVSTTNANCYNPKIAMSGRELIVVWYDDREKIQRIFSRRYNPEEPVLSKALTPEVKLSTGRYASKNPVSLSAGNRVVVMWQQRGGIAGKYSDVYVNIPAVYSRTHPNSKWSRSPFAKIMWKPPADESGIIGYATIFNNIPDFNPTIQNVNASVTRILLPNLDDGTGYFHIRAIDGAGNYSRTVHFPVKSSINPLPMPIVRSDSHPQGKSVASDAPVFKWHVDKRERLKGFLYGLAAGKVVEPTEFITDFEKKFEKLDDGIYFFSLVSVDKTNQKSEIADYPFIVGTGVIDKDYLKMIARRKTVKQPKTAGIVLPPSLEIVFPFDILKLYTEKSIKGEIRVKGISEKNIIGYSIAAGTEKFVPGKNINSAAPAILIDNLNDGKYIVGVRARYFRKRRGLKRYYWTKPVFSQINVRITPEISPAIRFALNVEEKFKSRALMATAVLFLISLSIIFIGFGTRLQFYIKIKIFKIRNLYRLLLG